MGTLCWTPGAPVLHSCRARNSIIMSVSRLLLSILLSSTDAICYRWEKPVMYIRMATNRKRKTFDNRWDSGIHLALVEKRNRMLAGTTRCFFTKLHCSKRRPAIQSYDPAPWEPTPRDEASWSRSLRPTKPVPERDSEDSQSKSARNCSTSFFSTPEGM